MKLLFLIAAGLQAVILLIDEFHFHWRRQLPRWERWGHPVDSLFFLLPLSVLSFATHTEFWQIVYIALAVFSCLIITKDEWIHQEKSSGWEQWLHANLFVLHPVVLISGFFLWDDGSSKTLLKLACLAIFGFMIYQLLFWNLYANRTVEKRLSNR
jgi:hypothetical protein